MAVQHDIQPHRQMWGNFVKVSIVSAVAAVASLALMALFLL